MKKNNLFCLLILLVSLNSTAQKQNNIWVFGDGVKINFDSSQVSNVAGTLNSLEACASICDKQGNLLFYFGGYEQNGSKGRAWDKNGLIIQNGDSIILSATSTQGALIVPFPLDSNRYYIITTSSWFQSMNSMSMSLYYSIVDLSLNNGNGAVISKNVLVSSDSIAEKIAIVKHANGRDWWVLTHSINSNVFYIYLINPQGLFLFGTQSIGFAYNTNSVNSFPGLSGEMNFSYDGTKLVSVSSSVADVFDFDRCMGSLSNYQDLIVGNRFDDVNRFYGCSFSPSCQYLYISNILSNVYCFNPPCNGLLLQYDVTSPNIYSTKQIISSISNSNYSFCQHQLANDNKIYLARSKIFVPIQNFDSVNTTLSVINFPDSAGSSSDFQISSFSLNGNRTYMGLPNMPNYNLGRLVNSPCDTLGTVSQVEVKKDKYNLYLYYDKYSQIAFVNAKGLKGKKYKLEIFNVAGQLVLEENGKLDSEYYTSDVALTAVRNGMYVVRLSTEKEVLNGKFVKY